MKNKREFLYLLARRLCIYRDIKALETMSGTEKEIEDLEKQDRFCLEQSLELTKDWPTLDEIRTTRSTVS